MSINFLTFRQVSRFEVVVEYRQLSAALMLATLPLKVMVELPAPVPTVNVNPVVWDYRGHTSSTRHARTLR